MKHASFMIYREKMKGELELLHLYGTCQPQENPGIALSLVPALGA